MSRMNIREIKRYAKSLVYGHLRASDWKEIETFCMFIGYQRSGHSFIGALLNAHPNAIMGMEVDALNLVQLGYSRKQLYYCLVRNSEVFTGKLGSRWTGYSYAVPGQFQGTFTSLRLIGDKKGGKSTLRMGENPELYERLKNLVKCRIKVLHVIRHPLDNISTMILRHMPEGRELNREDFMDKIDLYFSKADINQSLINKGEMDVLSIYHEDFINDPRSVLTKILDFTGLSRNESYIEACAGIVREKPHQSREKLQWPPDLLHEVNTRSLNYSFLKRYY
jgi:hypothetical protein